MIREVLKMGDPRLMRSAERVEDFDSTALDALVADMWDTVRAVSGGGLAAPQIGVGLRVVVVGMGRNPRYPHAPPIPPMMLVNPIITPTDDILESDWEGCLSVPGLRAMVPRYRSIHVEAQDQKGAQLSFDASGFHARVLQHECDHLLGRLFPSRIDDFTTFGFVEQLFPGSGIPS